MKVRAAVPDDAPALGRVMVTTWLTAHRGQMPEELWHKRVAEWTPEVSAGAWRRLLAAENEEDARVVLLVVEQDPGEPVALVLGTEQENDASGATAQINALYVLPDHQRRGIGRWLLQEAASELAELGFSMLHIGVLTANLPARAFYEAMGGQAILERVFEEEGVLLPETVYAWSDIRSLGGLIADN